MEYRNSYISPLGRILLTADEIGLTGLAFEGQKNAVQGLTRESEEKETTLFSGVKKWLDIEGIPVSCCMLLGYPAVHYQRTAPRKTGNIVWW